MKEFLSGGLFGAVLVSGGLAGLQMTAARTERIPQFENATVKAWKTVVAPHKPTDLHRHDHPRVIVALTDGTIQFVDQNGKTEQQVWEAGKAYWLPAMPPNTMHRDVNAGDKPLAVMVVELDKEY